MQFTLPASVLQKAERLALDRGFASVGDYVCELVRRDESDESPFQNRKAEIEAALLAGLESGPATPMVRSDWDELQRRVREVHGKKLASTTTTIGPVIAI